MLQATIPQITSTSSASDSDVHQLCVICSENIPRATETFCCYNHTRKTLCSECMTAYIENKISTGFKGFCPIIKCPQEEHGKEDTYLLSYEGWSKTADAKSLEMFTSYAESILAILCGNCHKQSSCLIKTDPANTAEYTETLRALVSPEEFDLVIGHLQLFSRGADSADAFYQKLLSLFPNLAAGDDADAWKLIKAVLGTIPDPERRASLQLRHFKSRPKMHTPCWYL